ncbi:MAG: chorismate mutase [Oscillospiraceae bacterium]|nr:chorismate mutase [Oscillospiraceae bacterium]
MNELDNLRNKIDETDDKIVDLLLERFRIVKNVGEYKKTNKLEIFQKDRETEVLQKIAEKINNQEYKKYILKIYAEILEMSKLSQHKK